MSRAIRLNPYGNKPGKTITRNAARAAFVGTPTRLRMVRTMRDGEEDTGDIGEVTLADLGLDTSDLVIDTSDIDPSDIFGGGGGSVPVLESNVDELIDIRQQIDADNATGGAEDVNPIFGGGKAQTGAGQLAGGGGEFGGETFQQTGAVDSNKSWFGGASGKAGSIAIGVGGGALVGGGIGALVGGKRKRLMGAGIGALVGVLLGGGGAYLAVGDK